MADLSRNEIEKVKLAFDTISMGAHEIDSSDIGCVLRALKLNPSLIVLEKLGATQKKGKKITVDEMLSIYTQAKAGNEKEGNYADFVGILELYDKHQDRRASAVEISQALTSLGEKLENNEVDTIMKDCMGEIDDEGTFEYIPFLKKLCSM